MIFFCNLQRFFGEIRMAGGSDDHPSSITFLQLYKILRTFKIFSISNSANCEKPTENSPRLLTIKDVKSLSSSKQKQKKDDHIVEVIKSIYKKSTESYDWNVIDVVALDHNYALEDLQMSSLKQLSAHIGQIILKKIKCNICKLALVQIHKFDQEGNSCQNEVQENTSSYQGENNCKNNVQEPFSSGLNHFVFIMEQIFSIHCNDVDVSKKFLDVIKFKIPFFPCEQHKCDIVSEIIYNFLNYRMTRQNTIVTNEIKEAKAAAKANARHQRKLAKHCKT